MKTLSRQEMVVLCERAGMLLDSGIPASEVFINLADEFSKFSEKFMYCSIKVKDGESMIDLLRNVQIINHTDYVVLKAGEKSGKLPEAFNSIANFREAVNQQISSAKTAIMPNIGLVFASIIVLYGIMVAIVPTIAANIKANKRAEFLVFNMSEAMIYFNENYAIYFLFGAVGIFAWCFNKLQTQQGKDAISKFLFSMPFLNSALTAFNLAIWSKQTSLMLSSGVPIKEVMEMTSDSLPPTLRWGLQITINDATNIGWQRALDKNNWSDDDARRLWPAEVFGALRAGGETGNLDVTLEMLSNNLRRLSSRKITSITTAVKYISFVFALSGVAFVVINVVIASLAGISK